MIRANTDMKLMIDHEQVLLYTLKYATKSEKNSDFFNQVLQKLNKDKRIDLGGKRLL